MPNDDCLTMENVFGKETESSWMWLERHGFVGDSTKENWCIGKIPERLSFLENLRLVVKRCVIHSEYFPSEEEARVWLEQQEEQAKCGFIVKEEKEESSK